MWSSQLRRAFLLTFVCAMDYRSSAKNAGRHRALQRRGIAAQRHPRRLDARHQPVLGDRDEQQVEEEPLVVRRLAAGEQQMEVLGEAQPAHQVAGQVAAPNLDPVWIRLADMGGGILQRWSTLPRGGRGG